MSAKENIFTSPELYLSHFEQADSRSRPDRAHFVKLSELDYRSPVFLQKTSLQKSPELVLSADELLEEYNSQKPARQVNAHVFHSAFCCSTLLSNLLDYKNRTLVLREPMAYLQFANWKRGQDSIEDNVSGPLYTQLLAATSASMASGFINTELSLIKHHNLVSHIIGDVLFEHDVRGLYIYSDLKSFIVSVLKSPGRRSWLRDQIGFSYTDAQTLDDLKYVELDKLDDVTGAVYLWLINIAQYRRASRILGPRLRSLNNRKLLDEPLESASRVASHLGLGLGSSHISEKIAHGVLGRHAKTPQLDYSDRQRKADLNKLGKLFRSEIKRGQKWAEKQANFSLAGGLPNPV